MKRIEVAVGILYDGDGRILVGQRVVQDLYYKKWEFPGGKIESGETAAQALAREFLEEVGIVIESSEPLMRITHDYPDRHVDLQVLTISRYQGQVKSMEGQALKWVTEDELEGLDFLQGNAAIIQTLKGQ